MSSARPPARTPGPPLPPGASTGPRRGPWFGPPRIESARDVRKALQRLLRYFGANKVLIFASTLFIAAATLLRAVGPALIGEAIHYDLELNTNLPDFIHRMEIVLATILGSWVADAGSGILMTRLSNNIIYRLRADSFARVQLALGRSIWSITRISTGALMASSLRPSCS